MLASRRRFGRGLGAALAVAVLPRRLAAHDGPHDTEVRIVRFAFVPDRVEIRASDRVVWLNDDVAPHTATADGEGWSTGPLGRGETGGIVFETSGEHPYFCAFHPHMRATVVVRPRPAG